MGAVPGRGVFVAFKKIKDLPPQSKRFALRQMHDAVALQKAPGVVPGGGGVGLPGGQRLQRALHDLLHAVLNGQLGQRAQRGVGLVQHDGAGRGAVVGGEDAVDVRLVVNFHHADALELVQMVLDRTGADAETVGQHLGCGRFAHCFQQVDQPHALRVDENFQLLRRVQNERPAGQRGFGGIERFGRVLPGFGGVCLFRHGDFLPFIYYTDYIITHYVMSRQKYSRRGGSWLPRRRGGKRTGAGRRAFTGERRWRRRCAWRRRPCSAAAGVRSLRG